MSGPLPRMVTLAEIAAATGLRKSSIVRRLNDGDRYPYRWRNGASGKDKCYFHEYLPDEFRLALARYDAEPENGLQLSCPMAGETVAAARQLLADEAARAEQRRLNLEAGLARFETLPEARQREALARRRFLEACEVFVAAAGVELRHGAKRSKAGDKRFIIAYNKGLIPVDQEVVATIGASSSVATLRRLADAYEADGLAGLARKYRSGRKKSTTVPEEIQEFILGVIYKKPHTKVRWLMKMIKGEFGGELPSESAVRRWLDGWKKDNRNLLLSIIDPDGFKNSVSSAMGDASENVTRLNQLWELDSTPGDVMLTDGRHNLVGIIEVFSRRMRLLVSPSSSGAAVSALIRRCLLEWGVPEEAKLDNGKDYVSERVQRVLQGLAVTPIILPPFSPEKKPHIERGLQTFSHGIVEYLPGYIGHNVSERKALEGRRSFSQRLFQKGEVIEVSMSSAELQAVCDQWIEQMYLHEPHGGLNGATPMEMVRRWRQPIRTISDERALDMLLAPAPTDGGVRVIQKKGVAVNKAWYTAVELMGQEREGRPVKVLLDPCDMGVIYVYFDQGDHLEFLCKAYNKARAGVDPREIAAVGKAVQNRYYSEQRKALRQAAKKVGNAAEAQEILRKCRANSGQIVEFPKVTEPYSSPGLEEAARAAAAGIDGPLPVSLSAEEEELADSMLQLGPPLVFERVIDAREKFHCKKVSDAGKTEWEKLDGFERYEFLTALPAMTESQRKWVAYFKTTSEYAVLADIYEENQG